jgi:iron(III) transport system ATP-binding protein
MSQALRLHDISHAYDGVWAVRDFSLEVGEGELVCLLGPSGCGKTTALRIAAGLEKLQRGSVQIQGRTMADGTTDLPPEQRGVGLVFQDYALFPHLRVVDNVAFGLRKLGAAQRRKRALVVLEQVGMAGFADTYPHTLSGGQQQRVALARALAPEPRVMLLDEPFSGLDARLRDQIRDETLHVLKSSGTATLIVTHDPEEAMFMADRIALMRAGGIVQSGTPTDLYYHPVSAFAAGFFSQVNRLLGTVAGGVVATPFGPLSAGKLADGTEVEVLIRPEALRLAPTAAGGTGTARVLAARLLGRSSLVHLAATSPETAPLDLHARVPGRFLPAENEPVSIVLDPTQAFVFPANGPT